MIIIITIYKYIINFILLPNDEDDVEYESLLTDEILTLDNWRNIMINLMITSQQW